MPAAWSAAERTPLADAYRRKPGETVLPAYRRLAVFMAREYRSGARDRPRRGGPHPGGVETVKRQVGFEGDLRAFFDYVRDDPKFRYGSAEEMLQRYRMVKAGVDARLPLLFAVLPRADYEIRLMEAFRAANVPAGNYQRASPDGRRPGVLYLNARELAAHPNYIRETLLRHQGSPGHHFQNTVGQETTGLHARGWTREEAIRCLLDNSSLAQSEAAIEVDRYIGWPGQALAYKTGQMTISRLRAKAERELGPAFDVREFHRQALMTGPVPMTVLEAHIGRWIRASGRQGPTVR